MAIKKSELIDWLNTLTDGTDIYIDDGGLTLMSTLDPEAYYEIGGDPEDEEFEEEVWRYEHGLEDDWADEEFEDEEE